MNLLLLHPEDFTAADRVRISARRLDHIRHVHRAVPGQLLRAGLVNGALGNARLDIINSDHAELIFTEVGPPPPPLPLTLLLALPRPKMLRRILQSATAMGVKKICLLNSFRVEKSFWQTPWLTADAIREQLLLGLEQAGDTRLPTVELRRRFKPFVEDELPALANGTRALVAHPGPYPRCPADLDQAITLAVGPEGGWIPYEVDLLQQAAGFEPISLGPRILRVETAVNVLLARLFS